MSIRISHDHVGLSITPDDLEATVAWYSRTLGFRVEKQFEAHGTTYTFLVSGDVRIELMNGASTRQVPTTDVFTSMDPARLHHFCLAVDDLDAAVAELADLGVALIGGPLEVPGAGQRIAFVADNLGNVIELTDPGNATSRVA